MFGLERKRVPKRKDAMADWSELSGLLAAKAYCLSEIEFYSSTGDTNFARWRLWQIVLLVFGVLGTITAAIAHAPSWAPWLHGLGWLRAIPVAISTLAGGLLTSFSYQSEYVRQGATADQLRGELALFQAGAAPYEELDDRRVRSFITNVRGIVAAENGRWIEETRARASNTK